MNPDRPVKRGDIVFVRKAHGNWRFMLVEEVDSIGYVTRASRRGETYINTNGYCAEYPERFAGEAKHLNQPVKDVVAALNGRTFKNIEDARRAILPFTSQTGRERLAAAGVTA